MNPRIIPIDQSSIKVCCGDEACVVIEVGERLNPDSDPPSPDEPDHGPDYHPGRSGILPYLWARPRTSGFMATVSSWEELRELVRRGEATWRFLEGSSSSCVMFVVRAGNTIDIRKLRDALGGMPDDLEVIVGVAPN